MSRHRSKGNYLRYELCIFPFRIFYFSISARYTVHLVVSAAATIRQVHQMRRNAYAIGMHNSTIVIVAGNRCIPNVYSLVRRVKKGRRSITGRGTKLFSREIQVREKLCCSQPDRWGEMMDDER